MFHVMQKLSVMQSLACALLMWQCTALSTVHMCSDQSFLVGVHVRK